MKRFFFACVSIILLISCSKERKVEPEFHEFAYVLTGTDKVQTRGVVYPGSYEVLNYGILVGDKPDIYITSSGNGINRNELNDPRLDLDLGVKWKTGTKPFIKAYAITDGGVFYSRPIPIVDSLIRQFPYKGGILMFARLKDDRNYPSISPVKDFYGATDSSDGLANQQKVFAKYKSGPFAYCENLTLGGYHDWYLPSYEELKFMLQDKNQFELSYKYYFSSTELDSNFFLGANTSTGKMEKLKKDQPGVCRCIRKE